MSLYCWIATLICLTGTIINIKRNNWCFEFWVVGEILWVAFDIGQGLWSRTILDLLGLALAVVGIYENQIKKRIMKNDK